MIIDSFDNQTEPIISPSAFFGDQQNYCDIAIATFSREIYDVVDQQDYTPEGLYEANHSMDKFYVALEIAEWIVKQ